MRKHVGRRLLWTRRGSTDRYYHFDGEGGTRVLTDDSQATTDTYMYNRFGVLESSTGSTSDRGAEMQRRIICFCVARTSSRLKVDCSCKGMGLWLRTENDGRWIGAKCDRIYDVDGFLIGGQLYKIEDGVCVDLVCENGRVEILSCVNWLARFFGAKHPYKVEIGRWGPPPSLVGPPVQGP